MAVKNYNWE